jgi:hypothetical protein
MLRLCHIDAIVVRVGTDPFDPDNALLEVDGGDPLIVVALRTPIVTKVREK